MESIKRNAKEENGRMFLNFKLTLLKQLTIVSILVIGILFFTFKLWAFNFNVPINYWGDTLWFLVPIKSMIDNGWVNFVPQLSAPYGLSAAGFPSMTNLDWVIMKFISLFNSNAGAVLNIFWFISIILTACSSVYALYSLGINGWINISISLVYAFLPYTFLRNVAHISLVFFIVPLLVTCAIYLAQGCVNSNIKNYKTIGYVSIIAQGFSYIYFSYFTILLFLFSGLLGYVNTKKFEPIKKSLIAIFCLIIISAINLIPSFYSWHEYGKPPNMSYKRAAEAEIYGLKIRKMIAPSELNSLPIVSGWGKKDKSANFPNENENVTARLGPLSSIGLILLILVSLKLINSKYQSGTVNLRDIAALSLFSLLITTVGGFGAVFNLIIPDFRAYNRFSVFIAFLCLIGLGLWWQLLLIKVTNTYKKYFLNLAFILLIIFSLYDQLLESRALTQRLQFDRGQAKQEQVAVRKIEERYPDGASIFQLPITGFPSDGGSHRALPYDNARPFIWSKNLNWSWPSFSKRHEIWQDNIKELEGKELVDALVLSGFSAIWIDKYGYLDSGHKLTAALKNIGLEEIIKHDDERYSVFDLISYKNKFKLNIGESEFSSKQEILLNSPSINWGIGFYGKEQNALGIKYRWSREKSSLIIKNSSSRKWEGKFEFALAAGNQGDIEINFEDYKNIAKVSSDPVNISLPISLEANKSIAINFISNVGQITLPAKESRDLHFYIFNWKLTK